MTTRRHIHGFAATAVASASVVLATAAIAASAASARRAAASTVAPCTSANTEVWLGLGLGGGTAGTTYYPLEFSNVGRHACSFYGYPGVSAYHGALHQLGPPAARDPQPHGTVALAPGATAHALLGVVDWGAVCSTSVIADGLKVYAPGQRLAQEVPFSFPACAHRGVLRVGPLHAGVGIPGHDPVHERARGQLELSGPAVDAPARPSGQRP
jgi:Domain of unknown function (DUF4232)